MPSVLTSDHLPAAHPLRTVRRLTDQALDDLGGLVAATESADAEGLPRRAVRLVMLQALCGLRSDAEIVQCLSSDDGCRWFVGLGVDANRLSATDCARLRRSVLGIGGFDEFLCVLLSVLERRGLLAHAMFAPDRSVLSGAMAVADR